MWRGWFYNHIVYDAAGAVLVDDVDRSYWIDKIEGGQYDDQACSADL